MPSSNFVGPNGERWIDNAARRRFRSTVFAMHGRTCWLCGHGGSQDADHLEPPKHGGSMFDPANGRPMHGAGGCPSCGRKCNQEKGDMPLAQVQRLTTSQDWYSR